MVEGDSLMVEGDSLMVEGDSAIRPAVTFVCHAPGTRLPRTGSNNY
ncbi:MAG: hypothetical protein NTW21_35595 [Verrucomicrobia bacterium]|nr:hypothetical protein [Verrucomicrobiota bacterium]